MSKPIYIRCAEYFARFITAVQKHRLDISPLTCEDPEEIDHLYQEVAFRAADLRALFGKFSEHLVDLDQLMRCDRKLVAPFFPKELYNTDLGTIQHRSIRNFNLKDANLRACDHFMYRSFVFCKDFGLDPAPTSVDKALNYAFGEGLLERVKRGGTWHYYSKNALRRIVALEESTSEYMTRKRELSRKNLFVTRSPNGVSIQTPTSDVALALLARMT